MKADALALGVIMLVGGLGLALWAEEQADSVTRIVYPEEYDTYKSLALIGYLVGALGAGIAVYEFASNPAKPSPRSPAILTSTPTGQKTFCSYCGAGFRPIDVWCPACGRKVLRE